MRRAQEEGGGGVNESTGQRESSKSQSETRGGGLYKPSEGSFEGLG